MLTRALMSAFATTLSTTAVTSAQDRPATTSKAPALRSHRSGHVSVNGLQMYYEVHGRGAPRSYCSTEPSRPSARRSIPSFRGSPRLAQWSVSRCRGTAAPQTSIGR